MKNIDTPLKIAPRAGEAVTIQVPTDVLELLRREASQRDTSVEALMRFYIGTGLRQDLAKRYSERVLDATERVLSQHLSSPTEVTEIIREIRERAVPHVT